MPGQPLSRYDAICAIEVISITTSDTTDQNPQMAFRGFMVGTAGDVAIKTLAGTTVTIKGCVVGQVYPIGVTRFLTTAGTGNTSATGILGLV